MNSGSGGQLRLAQEGNENGILKRPNVYPSIQEQISISDITAIHDHLSVYVLIGGGPTFFISHHDPDLRTDTLVDELWIEKRSQKCGIRLFCIFRTLSRSRYHGGKNEKGQDGPRGRSVDAAAAADIVTGGKRKIYVYKRRGGNELLIQGEKEVISITDPHDSGQTISKLTICEVKKTKRGEEVT